MIEKVDARSPGEQLVVTQYRIRGTRHPQELRGLTQVGVAGEITLPVLRPVIVACLNETLGEERLFIARKMQLPDGQHLEDIPVLTPAQFKTICETLGCGDVAKQTEEMRLSGSCEDACRPSYNPDPWRAGRRERRMRKFAGGKLTETPDGGIKGSVVYLRSEDPLPNEFVFVKVYDPKTDEVKIVAVVEVENPPLPPKAPRRQRPKPQPTAEEAQASLKRDGHLTEETMPF